jgi:ABC-type iron transport system FetAB ATPase subunit
VEASLAEEQRNLAQIEESIAETTNSYREASARLATQARTELLADRIDEAMSLLGKRIKILDERRVATASIANVTAAATPLAQDIAALSEELVGRRGEREALVQQLQDQRSQLLLIDEEGLTSRDEYFARLVECGSGRS